MEKQWMQNPYMCVCVCVCFNFGIINLQLHDQESIYFLKEERIFYSALYYSSQITLSMSFQLTVVFICLIIDLANSQVI